MNFRQNKDARHRVDWAKILISVTLGSGLIVSASGMSASASSVTAQVKPPSIISSGQLRFCSDITSPPLESFSPTQVPEGSDISIGNAIGPDLGLKVIWENTAFAGIIPALLAHHCDAILSQLYIKPARKLVVNFVPYMYSSESVTVPEANPKNITGLNSSLCGMTVSAVTGSTADTELSAVSTTCTNDGKAAIQVDLFTADIDALQNMLSGLSDVYTTTSETAAYYMKKDPGKFKFAGAPFGKILTGIAVNKDDPKLLSAIEKAFHQVRVSGQYNKIMTKWGLQRDEL